MIPSTRSLGLIYDFTIGSQALSMATYHASSTDVFSKLKGSSIPLNGMYKFH